MSRKRRQPTARRITQRKQLTEATALDAVLNGATSAFDASMYGGVAFYIKGTASTFDGDGKIMVLARMPAVLPGMGSCCQRGRSRRRLSATRLERSSLCPRGQLSCAGKVLLSTRSTGEAVGRLGLEPRTVPRRCAIYGLCCT